MFSEKRRLQIIKQRFRKPELIPCISVKILFSHTYKIFEEEKNWLTIKYRFMSRLISIIHFNKFRITMLLHITRYL